MWRKLLFVFLALVVVVAGVTLYRYRHRLFAPSFDKVGGTELVFEVDANEKDPRLEDLCRVLTQRFDRTGAAGLVVEPEGERRVAVRVPRGKSHDELVELIKSIAGRQGRLEFRIVANATDDEIAIEAARGWFKSPRAKKELERAENRNEPPPPPRHEKDKLSFPVALEGEPEHTYSWVEVGKSELFTLHLNSDALDKEPERKRIVDDALATGESFTLGGPNLFCVRQIKNWSKRRPGDRALGKKLEYFVLMRDPLAGKEITGDYLVNVKESKGARAETVIDFSFSSEGGELFYDLTSRNKPTGSPEVGFKRQVAIIFDGQVLSAPTLNEPIRRNGQISGNFTQEEIGFLVLILRAGSLPVRLQPDPVRETIVEAKK